MCAPLLAKGLELVDTPGTGSVYAHNTAAAAGARTRMDAAVLVLSADPPISAAERQLLSELDEQAVAVFCVLNKADYLDVDGLNEARSFTEQVLADATGRHQPIYPLSARAALAARQAGDGRALAASGLPVFEEAFTDFLARHRDQALLDDWRARRAAALDDALAALDDRLASRLDDQIRQVRSAAADLFSLDLLDPPEPTRLTSAARFRYAFAEDAGNVELLAAAIRTRLPGSLGRRRVAAHVQERVAELMEKQVGRARSDFQSRLQDTGHVMHRELDRRFEEGAGRLASAVRQAATLASRADAERIPAGERLAAHVAALTEITARLDE